jgi:hypothetical protein
MYKTTLLAVLFLTALTSCSKDDNAATKPDENTVTPDPKIEAPAGYTLVWSDEFDIDGLPDPKKWDYDTEANKTGWYNNEKQYYSKARLENSKVENGKLIITARKEKLSSMAD